MIKQVLSANLVAIKLYNKGQPIHFICDKYFDKLLMVRQRANTKVNDMKLRERV